MMDEEEDKNLESDAQDAASRSDVSSSRMFESDQEEDRTSHHLQVYLDLIATGQKENYDESDDLDRHTFFLDDEDDDMREHPLGTRRHIAGPRKPLIADPVGRL